MGAEQIVPRICTDAIGTPKKKSSSTSSVSSSIGSCCPCGAICADVITIDRIRKQPLFSVLEVYRRTTRQLQPSNRFCSSQFGFRSRYQREGSSLGATGSSTMGGVTLARFPSPHSPKEAYLWFRVGYLIVQEMCSRSTEIVYRGLSSAASLTRQRRSKRAIETTSCKQCEKQTISLKILSLWRSSL